MYFIVGEKSKKFKGDIGQKKGFFGFFSVFTA